MSEPKLQAPLATTTGLFDVLKGPLSLLDAVAERYKLVGQLVDGRIEFYLEKR